jgi:hypothetical protein
VKEDHTLMFLRCEVFNSDVSSVFVYKFLWVTYEWLKVDMSLFHRCSLPPVDLQNTGTNELKSSAPYTPSNPSY